MPETPETPLTWREKQRQIMGHGPNVELGKETRKEILGALNKIKSEISEAKRRNVKASDVAADILASGGGPFAAAKEAISFKASKTADKLKDKLDPLNIIYRTTGSKIATALAGRLMGRSETSIRHAAKLQPKVPQLPSLPSQSQDMGMADSNPMGSLMSSGPSLVPEDVDELKENIKAVRVNGEKLLVSLELVAKTLSAIASKVSAISDKLGATRRFKLEEGVRFRDSVTGHFVSKEFVQREKEQSDFLKNIWTELKEQNNLTQQSIDEQRDRKATEQYKEDFGKRKASIVKDKIPQVEEKEGGIGSWLSSIAKFIGPSLLPLVGAIAPVVAAFGLLAVSTKMVSDKWGDFKLSFSLLKDSVTNFYDTITSTLGSVKEWIGNTLTAGQDMIIDAGRSVVKGAKSLIGIKETPEQERAQLEKEAAQGSGYAQRKLAKEIAPVQETQSVASQVVPKYESELGETDQTTITKDSLEDGTIKEKAIDRLMGKQPTGTPEEQAAIGKVTRAIAETYSKVYKDSEGNPLFPSKDPQRDKRLPSIVDATLKSLAENMATKPESIKETATLPPVAKEVPPPAPKTGEILTNASDMKASVDLMAPKQQTPPIINNINNSRVNNNNIHQRLPNPRSSESSFIRATNRDFAVS